MPRLTISRIVLAVILLSSFNVLKGEDTIPVPRELEELVVTGDRAWIEDGKINFIPTKKEKQLSDSPESLLRGMNLPVLRETVGGLVGLGGETIVYFINGVRAEGIDIATFWPRNVKSVQYMPHPTGPEYEGVSLAINFIMDEYEAGGITRARLLQRWPFGCNPEVASKVVYKDLTFGAGFQCRIDRDKPTSVLTETAYRDMYYAGSLYDEVRGVSDSETSDKTDYYSAVVNARYTKNNFSALHAVAFTWDGLNGNEFSILSDFQPPILKGREETRLSRRREFSPRVSGRYNGRASEKWNLGATWEYAYMQNSDFSQYKLGENPEIANDADERVNSFSTILWATFQPSKPWTFQMVATYGLKSYSTIYTGSADTSARQDLHNLSGVLKAQWKAFEGFHIVVSPGVSAYLRRLGGNSYNYVYPQMAGNFNWYANRKVTVSGGLNYYMTPASAAGTNPVLTRVSELLWTEGDASLKNYTVWSANLSSAYLPTDWLNMSLYALYQHSANEFGNVYIPASKGMEGMVMKTINIPGGEMGLVDLTVNGNFLHNTLSVTLTPGWTYERRRDFFGGQSMHLNRMMISASADYTIRNVRFGVSYSGANKYFIGLESVETDDRWNFDFTYGIRNLLLNFRVENIFRTKSERREWYDSPAYSAFRSYKVPGRYFKLSLTYTFDYGKKVDRSINLVTPESIESSIKH